MCRYAWQELDSWPTASPCPLLIDTTQAKATAEVGLHNRPLKNKSRLRGAGSFAQMSMGKIKNKNKIIIIHVLNYTLFPSSFDWVLSVPLK